jgi:thiamine biosynthesis protein ThiS
VKLRVNGEEQEVAAGTTVTDLLETLGLSAKRVAIERNRVIVKQDQWAELALESGDELEIVHFVGGG